MNIAKAKRQAEETFAELTDRKMIKLTYQDSKEEDFGRGADYNIEDEDGEGEKGWIDILDEEGERIASIRSKDIKKIEIIGKSK